MTYVLYAAAFLIYLISVFFEYKKQLHMAQLEGYKPNQYYRWIKHNLKALFFKEILGFAAVAVIFGLSVITPASNLLDSILLLIYVAESSYLFYTGFKNKRKAKKPLVFTQRAVRLFTLSLILSIFWAALGFYFIMSFQGFVLYIALLRLIVPVNMLLSVQFILPLESLVNYSFYKDAQRKISAKKNLKIIGITGSYGKTSTKHFVKTILSEKYNTLMTPESYNTPMGITRVIREQLKDEHEVFVCEMGARYKGDIKTLGKLVHPTIGILTSIGPQHLETMKSIENVAKTKYELIEALPENGTAIFNGDNEWCASLAKNTNIETLIYGVNNSKENIYVSAYNIRNTREGLKFTVKVNTEIEFECHTPLLGKHNVSNILAAVCAALKLGLSPEEIERGISKITPVPHRLEIIPAGNDVTVIDDAFNSNPVGAREAVETIKELEGGNKIIITPGMVELGEVEYEENKKLGLAIARCCDYAILIGLKRTRAIVDGLKEGNFENDRMFIVQTLDEATAQLGKIRRPGDVVLFENDLPDNYNE